ncbi:unnamed protein product (macronuclear) [Paramecium tetraurelia]|uniref:Aquaporin n=1 Tax=Paramecium tetraurelia TaxID=5888 RepID=A0DU48_PARTE|nr:uncharacterized protein GSPATT00020236001 [Paramecium tetraurelia]CAK86565.1 unnamed protein product [Paramecium tetraurelia]|eukprot:XP_001453962.1 hypothetical protein (macronuclear) [Paramecium tetraurelia strain d4-2]
MEPIVSEFSQVNDDSIEKEKAQIKNILAFETAGTLLLIYGALAAETNFGVALVYFIGLMVCGRLSKGYFNPICTLIGYIDGSIPQKRAIYYIGAQTFASLIAGMLLMPLFAYKKTLPYFEVLPSHQVFGTLMSEIAGSIIFFIFIQIQTAENTKITTTEVQSAIFVSVIYFVARQYTATMGNSLFNPSAAFGLQLFYGIYYGKWDQMINLLIYIIGPWVGALLAITFFWKIYTPTLVSKQSN